MRYNKIVMLSKYSTLTWQESKNSVTIDCSLDIAIHPADNKLIVLTVPGVDGSVDGYNNKYIKIANKIQQQHGAAVVRMSNPFITSFHWESNIRRILEFISTHSRDITGHDDVELRIIAHSAGAAVVTQIAWEYPHITRLLLINPATKLGIDKIQLGLRDFTGLITLLFGSDDPSAHDINKLSDVRSSSKIQTVILDGVDHNFSGNAIDRFIEAPNIYLFDS